MKRGRLLRYLSHRTALFALLMCVPMALLAAGYVALLPSTGAPAWPLIAALLLAAALLLLFFSAVIRPYRRQERMIRLFLEGYTLSGISGEGGAALTPGIERLLHRVKEEFSASYLLKLSKRQAQYRALQNQINPHFLYNTLESIRSEALVEGLPSVAEMTEALAIFFRYTISKVENLVSLEEELHNCETYFRIQRYRFGERLQLRIAVGDEDREELYRCRLPKLTLQPILENSIIHGTEAKVGTGHIAVKLERTRDLLLIEVSDDGVGMDEGTLMRLNERLGKSAQALSEHGGEQGGSVALVNVNNRIHLLFGEEYGLHVYSMPGVGTDVQIVLPIITSDREALGKEGLL